MSEVASQLYRHAPSPKTGTGRRTAVSIGDVAAVRRLVGVLIESYAFLFQRLIFVLTRAVGYWETMC